MARAPLIRLLTRVGISPNSLTIAGVVITTAGAVAFFLKSPRLGGFLILLGGLCDAIDGVLARNAGKATRFGALLDSSVTGIRNIVMLFGIGGYFLMVDDYVSAAVTFLAPVRSLWSATPVPRRKLGLAAKVGVMQRPGAHCVLGAGAFCTRSRSDRHLDGGHLWPTSPLCNACGSLQTGCDSASRRQQ